MTGAAANFAGWLAADGGRPDAAGPDWLTARRHDALARLGELEVPTSRQEGWRYTSLKALLEQGFVRGDAPLAALQPDALQRILIPGLDSHRILLVNGRYTPAGSAPGDLPKGVRVGGLRDLLAQDPDALRERLNRVAGTEQSLFAALNTASLDDGLVLLLDRAVCLERPIELIHLSVGQDAPRVAQPRHLILLEDGAQATLIERYLSLDDALYCTNAVLELSLGRDAVLKHERIQMESRNAFHLTTLYLAQDAGSRYQGVNIGLGATWSRTELLTRFRGEQAECDLQGLYLAGDRQLMDYHLDVEHGVPRCTSRENFKGILYGKGRAVFDGRVLVARDAQKTDAAMSNRNLMLSASAEVDTKPQLEIHADDVKCSHGTTVGQIEPERLFYLRSRGIPAPVARRMLCLGFAGEIIETLSSEALREQVSEQVGQRLESAPLS
ncbi:Fe-S cluster assembly protein SufD [Thiobaca trueperi]|uniref:Iron-regulated ABC transporter permease protein SufD n=1 Tax=Thiobaca trueperi TaxID=127458 RepID=A0A4R3MTU9_9GAMM|nr:Fe-S cluster assembly protein SufD [Thiobaca trueperi]TCT19754.1 iron-regulated ABC transporter permease protein SufD [Thiobaca trueperi]